MKRIIIGIIIAVILVGGAILILGSPKSNSTTGSNQANTAQPSSSGPAKTGMITIQNFAFSPSKVIVHKGDTVTWTNQDEAHHNVNVVGGPEKSEGPLLAKGETYKKTFSSAGSYQYHCTPHPYMTATIEVQ